MVPNLNNYDVEAFLAYFQIGITRHEEEEKGLVVLQDSKPEYFEEVIKIQKIENKAPTNINFY